MMKIAILDTDTANKVAAGEVVERPSSAVKELIENAVDAGATQVNVECSDGGLTLLRVSDNGCGMSEDDARISVLRHATSKIRTIEDLSRVSSMGFRGEALPSIAAISRFVLETKEQTAAFATRVNVEGGAAADVSSCGREQGTTVSARDLFYNVPARKKFLKSASSENTHIVNMLTKFALANNNIALKYSHNGKMLLNTPGNGNLRDTIIALYGKNVAVDLLRVEFNTDNIYVSGYIAKPGQIRSNRAWQTFCVNNRVITSKLLFKALDNAYHSLLPRQGYVFAALHIVLPSENIDVNVHPQKLEIKFANEQEIYAAAYKSVSLALSAPAAGTAPLSAPAAAGNYTGVDNRTSASKYFSSSAPQKQVYEQRPLVDIQEIREAVKRNDNYPAEDIPDANTKNDFEQASEAAALQTTAVLPSVFGAFDDTYILAQMDGELLIVDQHAAHERVIYDRMHSAAERMPSQKLLVDEFVDVSAQECQLAIDHALDYFELGYTIEMASPTTIRISEIPADLSGSVAVAVFVDTLSYFATHHRASAGEIRHEFLQTAACKAACKAGDKLTMSAMKLLIMDLFATRLPYTCPHGRPTAIKYSRKELDKLFKRS